MTAPKPEETSLAAAHLYLREEQMRLSYGAFLLAWRALNAECEALLRENGLGPAHHRILFLVASHPGMTPGALLRDLGITKQSLGRALGDLRDRRLLAQSRDARDLRKRPLRLTADGAALERRLFQAVRETMTRAYRQAGGPAVEGFRRVLAALQSAAGEEKAGEKG